MNNCVDCLERELSKRGPYAIKYSTKHQYWWVDGSCGFGVGDYHNSKIDAIRSAIREIDKTLLDKKKDKSTG